MRLTRFRTWVVSGLIAGLATAAPAGAQLALEIRGGASVGNHAPAAAGLEKIPGPALSALVEYTTGQWGGVYAGFARASFGCEDGFCAGDEVAVTTQGFGAGVRLTLPLRSWLRLGGLFHNTRVDTAEGEDRTDPAPGYELGGGFAIPLTARFHLAPGVFYRTQFGDQRTTLLGADLGLRFAF